MSWTPRTKRDAIHEARARRAAHAAPAIMAGPDATPERSGPPPSTPTADDPYPGLDNPPAVCDKCRRVTTADMLHEVQSLPASVRGGAHVVYWCDACRERAFWEGAIDRVVYYQALGAPPDVLERVRAYAAAMAPHSQAAAAELPAMEAAGDTS